jgi:hypothetical protein
MRYGIILTALVLMMPLTAPAGDTPKGEAPKDEFADLSRMLHKMLVKQAPREIEHKIDWGKSVPFPEKLKLPNLPRTTVKVGERTELAQGAWRRLRVKLENPDKDVKVRVKEFRKQEKGPYRVVIDADVLLHCDGEWDQFLKGILLFKVEGQADTTVASTIVCDVDVAINFKKFPPEAKIDPKVVDMTLDLKDFQLNRLGGTLEGERIRQIGNDLLRDTLRDLLKAHEADAKQYANEAIAEALKENQGKFSITDLLKAVPKEKAKEK